MEEAPPTPVNESSSKDELQKTPDQSDVEVTEDDVKKKHTMDVRLDGAEHLENSCQSDNTTQNDGVERKNIDMQGGGDAHCTNNASTDDTSCIRLENVVGDTGTSVPPDDVPSIGSQETSQSCHDASQEPSVANINTSAKNQHESNHSRTACINDVPLRQQSETQQQFKDDKITSDSLEDETATSTASLTASSTSSLPTVENCSSPEAILLSISKSLHEDSGKSDNADKMNESSLLGSIHTAECSKVLSDETETVLRTEKDRELSNKAEVEDCSSFGRSDETISRGEVASSLPDDEQDDDLLSQLDAELDELLTPLNCTEVDPINGLLKGAQLLEELPKFKIMKVQCEELQRKVDNLHEEMRSMKDHLSSQQQQVTDLEQEKQALQTQMKQVESVQSIPILRIKELELLIEQQKVELSASKERQIAHDTAAKKAITKLQQEMILRVDQVKSMYEDAIKEKESIVIKYAKSEKEVLDQKKLREALGKNCKELSLTVESLKTQLHDTKKDWSKLKHTAASKDTEASYLQKEIDQLKEEVSSQGIKVKWAQNKLKTELDAHKETKVKLSKTEQRLTEAKEETEQIRKNCQEMIKTYQTSEEVKSNSLDKQLKVKHSELEQNLQEQKEHLEVHQARLRELDSLKKNLTDNMAELDSLKVKNKCLEDERLQNEAILAKFKELLNSQKEENRRLNKQLEEKKSLAHQLEDLKQTEIQLRSEVSGQKVDQTDLEMELETTRQKESELLQFTEKITSKNTSLSSENADLHSKTSHLESELQKLQQELGELQNSYSQLSSELKQEHQFRERESSLLTTKLNEKSRAVEQLSIQLDEARDDNKTLKRKHAANTKDLTRQLQQAHKRLESLDSPENPARDSLSVGSRTSSSGSLDTLPGSTPSAVNSSGSSVSVNTAASSKPEEHTAPPDHTVAIATGNDYPGVDKGMLVDRIVRLQKALQRKNEKIEFMQEHMTHLVDELKKKSKIIQQYIMRDEAGALVPVSSDINKPPSSLRSTMAQMSKQGGIMSSLYRSQSADPSMTLDLSLEINRKLQAVLEDTLLKNITLKENIETLGQEIARLLKEQQKQGKHHSSFT